MKSQNYYPDLLYLKEFGDRFLNKNYQKIHNDDIENVYQMENKEIQESLLQEEEDNSANINNKFQQQEDDMACQDFQQLYEEFQKNYVDKEENIQKTKIELNNKNYYLNERSIDLIKSNLMQRIQQMGDNVAQNRNQIPQNSYTMAMSALQKQIKQQYQKITQLKQQIVKQNEENKQLLEQNAMLALKINQLENDNEGSDNKQQNQISLNEKEQQLYNKMSSYQIQIIKIEEEFQTKITQLQNELLNQQKAHQQEKLEMTSNISKLKKKLKKVKNLSPQITQRSQLFNYSGKHLKLDQVIDNEMQFSQNIQSNSLSPRYLSFSQKQYQNENQVISPISYQKKIGMLPQDAQKKFDQMLNQQKTLQLEFRELEEQLNENNILADQKREIRKQMLLKNDELKETSSRIFEFFLQESKNQQNIE